MTGMLRGSKGASCLVASLYSEAQRTRHFHSVEGFLTGRGTPGTNVLNYISA